MPRWFKVSLIVGLVLLVLVGGVLAFGPGEHGPGRHVSGGSTNHSTSTGNHTAPTTHHGESAGPATTVIASSYQARLWSS